VYVTTRQAGEELGISPNSVKKLIAAGVLPTVQFRGVRATLPLSDVQTLAARRWISPSLVGVTELPVLRVDAAESVNEPDRVWIGYGAKLSAFELIEALRGWWKCDPERAIAAGFLPVTVSGFVVAVMAELSLAESQRFEVPGRAIEVRHRFSCQLSGHVIDLVAANHRLDSGQGRRMAARTRRLLGNRIASLSGGPIAYVREPEPDQSGGSA